MSKPKEPNYFPTTFNKGSRQYYLNKYFDHRKKESVLGEAQHSNLFLPFVPKRIHRYFPEASLIAILRNPVKRAHSRWWHAYSGGVTEKYRFTKAIEENLKRLKKGITFQGSRGIQLWKQSKRRDTMKNGTTRLRTYIDRGYYVRQLKRYLNYFPKKQLKIIKFEEFIKKPVKTTRDIFRFIGVSDDVQIQKMGALRPAMGQSEAKCYALIRSIARKFGVQRSVSSRLKEQLWNTLHSITGTNNQKPKMNPEIKQWLNYHYNEKNKNLTGITPFDFFQ